MAESLVKCNVAKQIHSVTREILNLVFAENIFKLELSPILSRSRSLKSQSFLNRFTGIHGIETQALKYVKNNYHIYIYIFFFF
jgi:hypothetical protein